MTDLRLALRVLLRKPGFTAVAVLTLALGIGVNTAIFSLVEAVLLRPLPFRQADRLVSIDLKASQQGQTFDFPWDFPHYSDFVRVQGSYQSVAAWKPGSVNLTNTDRPERLDGEQVSASYFPMLGVSAARGRVFTADEDKPGDGRALAVIGYGLWQRRFGGDTEVLGRQVWINQRPLTVVGIMPRGFKGLSGSAEVWTPVTWQADPKRLENPGDYWLWIAGRLRDGVSLAQGRQEASAVLPRLTSPKHWFPSNMKFFVMVAGLQESRTDPRIRRSVLVLYAAVMFVLLIACGNLANLLLSRAVDRRRDTAVRLALGARRFDVIRQFLAECLVIAALGGAAGLLIANWMVTALVALRPEIAGAWGSLKSLDADSVRIDALVVSANVAIALLAALISGLLPAWQASRARVVEAIRGSAPRGLRLLNARTALIAGELALACVLLAGAGLMLRTFSNLLHTDLGFDAGNTLTFRVDLPEKQYSGPAVLQFANALRQRLATLPGVESAAAANAFPVSGEMGSGVIGIGDEDPVLGVPIHSVSPEFFHAAQVPLQRGRSFGASDTANEPHVIVLSSTAEKRLFPGADPVGKQVRLFASWKTVNASVIGVVGDVHYSSPETPPDTDVYVSSLQYPEASGFIVRTRGDASALVPAVRQAVASLDKDLPIFDVKTMDERVAVATSRARFSAALLGVFAAVALILAAVGLYGAVSYAVAARTRDIGVRMALGAERAAVLRMVLADGARVAFLGLASGIPAALAATRALSSLLYGINPRDPVTFVAVPMVLFGVTMLATYIPARRAARVDPIAALRYE